MPITRPQKAWNFCGRLTSIIAPSWWKSSVKQRNGGRFFLPPNHKCLTDMQNTMKTAGETATTNQFDAEIVGLKQERDTRFGEINLRIEKLQQENACLNRQRKLNDEQIRALAVEKDRIGKEYKNRIASVCEKKDEYYCNRISSVHYRRFAAFCDRHPEVLSMWREFRQEQEGGEQ